jgi:hypothetical protein
MTALQRISYLSRPMWRGSLPYLAEFVSVVCSGCICVCPLQLGSGEGHCTSRLSICISSACIANWWCLKSALCTCVCLLQVCG